MGCGEAGEAFRGPGEVGGRLGVRASRVGSGGATRGARGGGARNSVHHARDRYYAGVSVGACAVLAVCGVKTEIHDIIRSFCMLPSSHDRWCCLLTSHMRARSGSYLER